jgi:hypothetical protein
MFKFCMQTWLSLKYQCKQVLTTLENLSFPCWKGAIAGIPYACLNYDSPLLQLRPVESPRKRIVSWKIEPEQNKKNIKNGKSRLARCNLSPTHGGRPFPWMAQRHPPPRRAVVPRVERPYRCHRMAIYRMLDVWTKRRGQKRRQIQCLTCKYYTL